MRWNGRIPHRLQNGCCAAGLGPLNTVIVAGEESKRSSEGNASTDQNRLLAHMEQLHLCVPAEISAITSKCTSPQWHLPVYSRFIVIASVLI